MVKRLNQADIPNDVEKKHYSEIGNFNLLFMCICILTLSDNKYLVSVHREKKIIFIPTTDIPNSET
jgi:hypothetical protein